MLRKNPEERRSLFVSFMKTNQSMLRRELIAVCTELLIKYNCTLCGQNVEFFNVKHGGI